MTQSVSSASALRLDGVASDTRRTNTRANLDQAGEQFEAIFVQMMMKSMRSASLGESLFDNNATEQFRDMQDQQFAKTMAAHTPLGIGKAMTDFLSRAQPSSDAAVTPDGQAPDNKETGS